MRDLTNGHTFIHLFINAHRDVYLLNTTYVYFCIETREYKTLIYIFTT